MFGSGMSGTSNTDSGVSGGMSAIYLTWRQNCKKPVYVIMTCNEDMKNFPMAWLRSGRLDQIFFVDLPGDKAREEVFQIHLRDLRGWDVKDLDLKRLSEASKNYSPAEIEQAVEEAILIKMEEDGPRPKPVTTEHLLRGIDKVQPMSVSNAAEIKEFRDWADRRGYPGVLGQYGTRAKSKTMTADDGDAFGGRTVAASQATSDL